MNVDSSFKLWMPEGCPSYLCLNQPNNETDVLLNQAQIMEILVEEAGEEAEEILGNWRLNLPTGISTWINSNELTEPGFPTSLFLFREFGEDNPFWDWKKGIRQALTAKQADPQEIADQVEELELETFLGQRF